MANKIYITEEGKILTSDGKLVIPSEGGTTGGNTLGDLGTIEIDFIRILDDEHISITSKPITTQMANFIKNNDVMLSMKAQVKGKWKTIAKNHSLSGFSISSENVVFDSKNNLYKIVKEISFMDIINEAIQINVNDETQIMIGSDFAHWVSDIADRNGAYLYNSNNESKLLYSVPLTVKGELIHNGDISYEDIKESIIEYYTLMTWLAKGCSPLTQNISRDRIFKNRQEALIGISIQNDGHNVSLTDKNYNNFYLGNNNGFMDMFSKYVDNYWFCFYNVDDVYSEYSWLGHHFDPLYRGLFDDGFVYFKDIDDNDVYLCARNCSQISRLKNKITLKFKFVVKYSNVRGDYKFLGSSSEQKLFIHLKPMLKYTAPHVSQKILALKIQLTDKK